MEVELEYPIQQVVHEGWIQIMSASSYPCPQRPGTLEHEKPTLA
jgi:hypothetical protein